jgi:N-acetylneuraminic acid mutarotase
MTTLKNELNLPRWQTQQCWMYLYRPNGHLLQKLVFLVMIFWMQFIPISTALAVAPVFPAPSPGLWTLTSANGLNPRSVHTAVWTGTEMIIWGGYSDDANYNDGARYNPSTNTWTALPPSGLVGRGVHTAVWTGTEMIVWGGFANNTFYNDGARYNPTTNTWKKLPALSTGTFAGRARHTAIWTGSEMIIWGGWGGGDTYYNDGLRYNPTHNAWGTVEISSLAARYWHSAVWTGSNMIVWGGYSTLGDNHYYNDGARYNPASNTWTALASSSLSPRRRHTAIWSGSEMIVWGGYYDGNNYNDGARYNPVTDTWATLSATSGLAGRSLHTAIWTGSEMVVWGGTRGDGSTYYNDGAFYDPLTNTWTTLPLVPAGFAGRSGYTAVWTGSEMIVWGGVNFTISYNNGARYRMHPMMQFVPMLYRV